MISANPEIVLRVHPMLGTGRLLLRPFVPEDAARLSQIAGARRIANTMISVAHPLSLEQARRYIERFQEEWKSGAAVNFAIVVRESAAEFVGYLAVKNIDHEHGEGELSFWIDHSAEGKGYITEAARCVIDWAFQQLRLNRICAYHMARNPTSGRVLAKLGMTQEGRLRQRVLKWGAFEDAIVWAILRGENVCPTCSSNRP